jgi:electron-transferring-flavoprotein dehydrogenase
MQEREALEFDVLFVGAGPANLASAIHLQRLLKREHLEASIAVIDKGRYPGAHLLSGAVLDTRALEKFFPDYRQKGCPIEAAVSGESIWFLTGKKKFPFPFIPAAFSNEGNQLVSLSRLGTWMAEQADNEGVQLFDNIAASAPYIENGRLAGIVTDDKGLDRNGNPKSNFEPGLLLKAKVTVIGEGSDGSLLRQLSQLFPSEQSTAPQRYSTGVKETWRIPEGRLKQGEVHHMFGYPLSPDTYGGGWIYAFSPTLISIGFVTSIGSSSPVCDPHLNMQRFKQHPMLAEILKGGSMIESGARTITSGGLDAMPKLYGPGFLVTGESAGLVNMQRQKGVHLAMKSGTVAAETLFEAVLNDDFSDTRLKNYEERFRSSWAYEELHAARNYRKTFDQGLYAGLFNAGLQLKFPGLSLAASVAKKRDEKTKGGSKKLQRFMLEKEGFKPDGILTFSKDQTLYRSGTMHEEDQPCHLVIKPEDIAEICMKKCTVEFGNPCQYFCPASVYVIVTEPQPALKLNPSNCLHCKTCEIADPYGVITWTTPEAGGGPGYKLS